MTFFKNFLAPPTIPEPLAKQVTAALHPFCVVKFPHILSSSLPTTFLFFVLLPTVSIHTQKLNISGFFKICFLCFINFPHAFQEKECPHLRGTGAAEEGEKDGERASDLMEQANTDKYYCVPSSFVHSLFSALLKQNKTKQKPQSKEKQNKTEELFGKIKVT